MSFTLVFSAGAMVAADGLQPGASLAAVQAALGKPRGQLHMGDRQVLYYERGAVELQQGALTRLALRTPEEHELLLLREERLRGEQAVRRAEMVTEGSALRDRKLADATFLAAPLAYQVAFWEDFARRYPVVSVTEPLSIARLRLNEQLEAKRDREEATRHDRIEAIRRLADREEKYASANRFQGYYPVRTYSSRYDRHHHQPFGLGPITYTFFDSPLPPYSTPSGNPAGNLTGLPINPSGGIAVQSWQGESTHSNWHRDNRSPRSSGRKQGPGNRHHRERM